MMDEEQKPADNIDLDAIRQFAENAGIICPVTLGSPAVFIFDLTLEQMFALGLIELTESGQRYRAYREQVIAASGWQR